MNVTISDVARLRERTGIGVSAAKKALEEADGDFDKAVEVIRKSGKKVAASKLTRQMREGLIGHYVHANSKVAALVVVTCETDFVARGDDFKQLVHDIALHIAALNPRYVKPEDVPEEVLEKEREIVRAQVAGSKKPAAVVEKIIEGKLETFFKETCLVRQPYVKDESMTIGDLITAAIQKLGENIQVREFVRLSL
ncbi:MAG: translation elongation factor Ts [Candidatus Kerfeldbacteria bacterium]